MKDVAGLHRGHHGDIVAARAGGRGRASGRSQSERRGTLGELAALVAAVGRCIPHQCLRLRGRGRLARRDGCRHLGPCSRARRYWNLSIGSRVMLLLLLLLLLVLLGNSQRNPVTMAHSSSE